jgi:hypothetical protein
MSKPIYEIVIDGIIAYICHSEHERIECVGHLIGLNIDFSIN